MKNLKLYFDLLNYLFSNKKRSTEDLLTIIDRYFKDLSIPFVLCLQKGKGLDKLNHPNLYRFEPEIGLDDDQIILRLAKENDSYVVSNDEFKQYNEFQDFVSRRRVGHCINNGHLKLFIPSIISQRLVPFEQTKIKMGGYA